MTSIRKCFSVERGMTLTSVPVSMRNFSLDFCLSYRLGDLRDCQDQSSPSLNGVRDSPWIDFVDLWINASCLAFFWIISVGSMVMTDSVFVIGRFIHSTNLLHISATQQISTQFHHLFSSQFPPKSLAIFSAYQPHYPFHSS